MAENIRVIIRERRAQVEGAPVIICGNSGYSITFDFDADWTRVGARTARFVYTKDGQVQHEDVIFTGDTVEVPVLSEIAYVDVGVFEGDICTTTPARISCKKSILCGSGEIHEPTPDVYAQLMALLNQIAEMGAGGATEAQVRQIEANTAGVEANRVSIEENAADIEANRASIEANTASIGANRASIEANTASIGANRANIEKLTNGAAPAGNAEKLGGQTPDYYAKAENFIPGDNYVVARSATGQSPDGYVYQLYAGNGGLKILRSKDGWQTVETWLDLANYLPKTGGIIDGSIQLSTPAALSRVIEFVNSTGYAQFGRWDNGTMGLYDSVSGWIFGKNPGETPLFHGVATGNLPLTGGTLSGALAIRNGWGGIDADNSASIIYARSDATNPSLYRCLRVWNSVARHLPIALSIYDNTTGEEYVIHHDGNAAPVKIQATAPDGGLWVW